LVVRARHMAKGDGRIDSWCSAPRFLRHRVSYTCIINGRCWLNSVIRFWWQSKSSTPSPSTSTRPCSFPRPRRAFCLRYLLGSESVESPWLILSPSSRDTSLNGWSIQILSWGSGSISVSRLCSRKTFVTPKCERLTHSHALGCDSVESSKTYVALAWHLVITDFASRGKLGCMKLEFQVPRFIVESAYCV
jgi:hypothetical protein